MAVSTGKLNGILRTLRGKKRDETRNPFRQLRHHTVPL